MKLLFKGRLFKIPGILCCCMLVREHGACDCPESIAQQSPNNQSSFKHTSVKPHLPRLPSCWLDANGGSLFSARCIITNAWQTLSACTTTRPSLWRTGLSCSTPAGCVARPISWCSVTRPASRGCVAPPTHQSATASRGCVARPYASRCHPGSMTPAARRAARSSFHRAVVSSKRFAYWLALAPF